LAGLEQALGSPLLMNLSCAWAAKGAAKRRYPPGWNGMSAWVSLLGYPGILDCPGKALFRICSNVNVTW